MKKIKNSPKSKSDKKSATEKNKSIDIIDQHPRPALRTAFVRELGMGESLSAVPAVTSHCTKSTINTTGSNEDENNLVDSHGDKTYIGNFHKGLPHNAFGEVDPTAYQSLLTALSSKTQADFAAITLGGGRKLINPQAGLAKDTEGPGPNKMKMRSAPKLISAEAAAEAVELYWMALLRDVPFAIFNSSSKVADAVQELSGLTDFTGPKAGGHVTPQTIFRGCSAGSTIGPFISQFLLKEIPYGSLTINQRQRTVLGEGVLGVGNADYMKDFSTWLDIQNGSTVFPADLFDGTKRYIRNMRDMGQYVHVDALYEAYLNACLILLGMNAPLDAGNPYNSPKPASTTQVGFGTFGGPHILSLVCEAATRALKVVWYQKWFVHRRLRPEAYGGLIHQTNSGTKAYPVDAQALNSQAVANVFTKNGTYLLPMAFPEGSPTHPAYGAGHATVAGACVTILKAFFDENTVITNPVIATTDGTDLVTYVGADAGDLTVGGELNKVAANIAVGRNMAGVHWRSDYYDSIRLGERVAICILSHQSNDYNEDCSFSFTNFDGNLIKIDKTGVTGMKPNFMPCIDRDEDVL
ncbi:MAG: vanadium-dependent haloperoxidase [Acidobacteria bacterium]|nr:vanadium-dependent haloperoxidase [Acidobacteriota bacterium]